MKTVKQVPLRRQAAGDWAVKPIAGDLMLAHAAPEGLAADNLARAQ